MPTHHLFPPEAVKSLQWDKPVTGLNAVHLAKECSTWGCLTHENELILEPRTPAGQVPWLVAPAKHGRPSRGDLVPQGRTQHTWSPFCTPRSARRRSPSSHVTQSNLLLAFSFILIIRKKHLPLRNCATVPPSNFTSAISIKVLNTSFAN